MSGADRITVEAGATLPRRDWSWECSDTPEAWPYVGPTWLAATATVMPEVEPLHTVAHRGRGETALLPGFLFHEPGGVDFDPRTYLGWEPRTGEQVCCGVETCSEEVDEVEAMGQEAFFPAMVVGSPFGYRSEAAFTFWTPALFGQLVEAAIAAAAERGARSVIAPWIPDRPGNEHLVGGFLREGGSSGLWGFEDYLRLDVGGYDAYVASLPARRRRRLKEDLERTERAGVAVERVSRGELVELVPRIAELSCRNREKYGAGERPEHIEGILRAMLLAGADVRCYAARRDGEVVGTCIGIRKADRLFVKWVGFDYEAIGTRSGVYFALVLGAPVRDACEDGLRFVECGAGAHQSKVLRGCRPRRKTTAIWVADEAVRPAVRRLQGSFAQRRAEAFGEVGDRQRALPLAPAAEGTA